MDLRSFILPLLAAVAIHSPAHATSPPPVRQVALLDFTATKPIPRADEPEGARGLKRGMLLDFQQKNGRASCRARVCQGRSRWSPYHYKKNTTQKTNGIDSKQIERQPDYIR